MFKPNSLHGGDNYAFQTRGVIIDLLCVFLLCSSSLLRWSFSTEHTLPGLTEESLPVLATRQIIIKSQNGGQSISRLVLEPWCVGKSLILSLVELHWIIVKVRNFLLCFSCGSASSRNWLERHSSKWEDQIPWPGNWDSLVYVYGLTDQFIFIDQGDLLYPIPFALVLICVRYLIEK